MNPLNDFIGRWKFIRSETLELLSVLTDEQLQLKPSGERWQPLFYQFNCMARTQLVYAEAARSGTMDFSLFGSSELPDKNKFQTEESIFEFLSEAEKIWQQALAENKRGVDWPQGNLPLLLHIQALAEHERLHHGQLISYFTIAHFKLPDNFKNNWAL